MGIFDYAAFYGEDEDGRPVGYGYDYLRLMEQYGGFTFEYVYGDWAHCQAMLENGEIDLLDSLQKTPERKNNFTFSRFSTGTSFGEVRVRADADAFAYNDFPALDGKRFGLLRGNSRNQAFLEFARKVGFSATPAFYDTAEELSRALQSGKVDAIVSSNLRQGSDEKPVARFAPLPFYMATRRDNTALINRVDETLERIFLENPDINARLWAAHYMADRTALLLTREEREFLTGLAPLSVAHDRAGAPFSSGNGAPVGVNADILDFVARKSGLRFQFLGGQSRLDAFATVAEKRADMLLGYDRDQDGAAAHGVRSTRSFLNIPMAIVGRKTTVFPTAAFALSADRPGIQAFVRSHFPQSAIAVLPSIGDCYAAIERGEADFTLENIHAATRRITDAAAGDLKVVLVTPIMDRMAFAFRSDIDPRIVRIIDKIVYSLPQTEKDSFLLHHAVNHMADSSRELAVSYRNLLALALAILAAAIIAGLLLVVILQRRNRNRLWRMLYIDPVTGAATLCKFKEDAKAILEAHPDAHYAATILDIENFKFINEMRGFDAGDELLRRIADVLAGLVHSGGGTFGRVSNDEFILLMPLNAPEEGEIFCRKMESVLLEQAASTLNHGVRFRFGQYHLPKGKTDVTSIIERANYAHRLAKKMINRNFCRYDDIVHRDAVRDRLLESHMEDALLEGRFLLYLQPKFNLGSETLTGAEALVRWNEGGSGEIVYPNAFIPLFEKNGFITKLDMYMLRKSCQTIAQWIAMGIKPIPISVNFSRLHLTSPTFISEICAIVDEYRIPREFIEIELTESTIFDNEEQLLRIMETLHGAGFTLSMDDFGTGYSSLGLLKNIHVDVIKFDRSFFLLPKNRERASTVLEHVINMAKSLDIRTVAEGVEEKEHIELLNGLGCDMAQGYYYSRPMPERDFTQLMLNRSRTDCPQLYPGTSGNLL